MGGLAALVALPIIMYAAFEATAVEITNLSVWLFTGAAFAYIAFRAADTTRRRAFLAERDLAAERDRSETLLLNVLPETIADQLKEDSGTIAERFEMIRTKPIAWLVAFAASAIGFVLIVREIDGGYLAGVAALVIPMVLVGLSLTHLQATGGLAALVAWWWSASGTKCSTRARCVQRGRFGWASQRSS